MLEFNKHIAKIAFNLHFATQRIIVSAITLLFISTCLSGQEVIPSDSLSQPAFITSDSLARMALSVKQDTSRRKGLTISSDAIDKNIVYNAKESIKNDFINKRVILIGEGKVDYGDISLTADSIVLEMDTGSVYATGRPDSTGKLIGKPVFRQGDQEFEFVEVTYNFKSKKAYGKTIRTEEEGGYLISNTAKLNDDGTIFVDRSSYSTCESDHPHFYISLKKAKFYPGEKIVSGPANLVVADIPLPLIIPYGFFPIQAKKASGFIMPKLGQENARGYYLSDGGFYFAINDYFDLELKGSVYTNKTWLASATTTYKVRYKFNGSFSFGYANNVSGYKEIGTDLATHNYKINWSHTQDAKANPSSRFSASVNMSSSGYDKNNSYNVSDLNTTTRSSSINYSKSWTGTPFNFSTSFMHNQNTSTDVVNVNLPKATFTVSRFYPLKPKHPVKSRWYHDLQMQYSAKLDNRINTYDSILFTNQVWGDMINGFQHDIPVSIPIKAFSNFSISPTLSYTGVVYTEKVEKFWVPDYYDPELNKIVPSVIDSTYKGLYYAHAIKPSISASYSPSVYGYFTFNNPQSRVQKIRHVIKPSASFSYVPSFPGLASDIYKTVQKDVDNNMMTYSIFENGIYGSPSLPKRSASVSLGLVNLLEAKVFSARDTTNKPRNVKLADINANTSYNVFADSCRWSNVSLRFGTSIASNINVDVSSQFNLYAINEKGAVTKNFAYNMGQGLARLTSFSLSVDFDLAKLLSGDSGSKQPADQKTTGRQGSAPQNQGNTSQQQALEDSFDEFGYVNFDMPWSMRVRYNYSYSKSGLTPSITNSFTISGDVKVTPKLSLTYQSGYDVKNKELGHTSISIVRDLHCWQMSFSWFPVGTYKSWNFTIRPKSGLLQDLKYERKRDRHETY